MLYKMANWLYLTQGALGSRQAPKLGKMLIYKFTMQCKAIYIEYCKGYAQLLELKNKVGNY